MKPNITNLDPANQRSYQLKFQKTVHIDRPRNELYRFWRDFENLPRFMEHVRSVECLDDLRSHWVAKAPLGNEAEWDAEIVTDVENSVIGWQSLKNSGIENAGSVRSSRGRGRCRLR